MRKPGFQAEKQAIDNHPGIKAQSMHVNGKLSIRFSKAFFMNEQPKEWSDARCTLIIAILVAMPLYPGLGIDYVTFVTHGILTAVYFGLVKLFGSGSVIEMGIIVLIMAILIVLFASRSPNFFAVKADTADIRRIHPHGFFKE